MLIVGYVKTSADNQTQVPVYWTSVTAAPQPLSSLGYGGGQPFGVNNNGLIVGFGYNLDNFILPNVPVYWASITADPQSLSLTGYANGAAFAYGVNNNGLIVGATFPDILPFPDSTVVPQVPTYWSSVSATPQSLPYTSYGGASGVNNNGLIVGFGNNENNQYFPLYWTNVNAAPQTLSSLGYSSSYPTSINDNGLIVGSGIDGSNQVPIYWSSIAADPLPLSSVGYTGSSVEGVNNNGLIVGSGINNSGVTVPLYWSSISANPQQLNLAGYYSGAALGLNDPTTPMPTPVTSDICFPAGTPIKTDQGIVNIEYLDPNKHTIQRQPILFITQTTTLDKYLISFDKSAVKYNCPTQKTLMSKDHKIEFEGRMVPAYRFLDHSDKVKKVKYSGETLYNVLLPTYGKMEVNNLICETLHPENQIAKLYNSAKLYNNNSSSIHSKKIIKNK